MKHYNLRKTKEFTCVECGDSFLAQAATAKYCPECKDLRLQYHNSKSKKLFKDWRQTRDQSKEDK